MCISASSRTSLSRRLVDLSLRVLLPLFLVVLLPLVVAVVIHLNPLATPFSRVAVDAMRCDARLRRRASSCLRGTVVTNFPS